jgi:endonuclease I
MIFFGSSNQIFFNAEVALFKLKTKQSVVQKCRCSSNSEKPEQLFSFFMLYYLSERYNQFDSLDIQVKNFILLYGIYLITN